MQILTTAMPTYNKRFTIGATSWLRNRDSKSGILTLQCVEVIIRYILSILSNRALKSFNSSNVLLVPCSVASHVFA